MILLVLNLLCGSVLAASPSKQDDLTRILDKQAPEFSVYNADEFAGLCAALSVPCGEELPSQSVLPLPDKYIMPLGRTVRSLLDQIASGRRGGLGYFWKISDGVLVLRPLTPHVASPLDNRIHIFVRKGQPLWMIIDGVANAEWMRLTGGKITAGYSAGIEAEKASEAIRNKTIDISCINLTVREILNTAVRTHGHGMWIYTYAPPSRFMPDFTRRGMLDSDTY